MSFKFCFSIKPFDYTAKIIAFKKGGRKSLDIKTEEWIANMGRSQIDRGSTNPLPGSGSPESPKQVIADPVQ